MIYYSKGLAKERKEKVTNSESKSKKLEISLDDAGNLSKYIFFSIYNQLQKAYELETNMTGMSKAKNQYFLRIYKNNQARKIQ